MGKRYFWLMFLLALLAPMIGSMILWLEPVFVRLLGIRAIPERAVAVIYTASTGAFLLLAALCVERPVDFSRRCLPLLVAFCCYMLAWLVIGTYTGYDTGYTSEIWFIRYLALPYYPLILRFARDELLLFPLYPAAGLGFGALLISTLPERVRIQSKRLLALSLCAAVALGGVYGAQLYRRGDRQILAEDPSVSRVGATLDIIDYLPFTANNMLEKPDEQPALRISADYPRLDGATALYPLYAAVAQALYDGLNNYTVQRYVDCSKTAGAYERLVDGEADLIFAAQPSEQQLAYAREKGVELTLTPISKEAFVFFVNGDNPVDGLTAIQIQDIYQRRIGNWRAVGGRDEPILPFQRNQGSGSQTAMEHEVMRGKKLAAPVQEEIVHDMGGAITRVAEYRDYPNAIGYSFRFYTQVMKPDQRVKLLAVDGVPPTIENIRSDAYPFTVEEYAVTAGSTNPNVQPLIDWLLSDQGQAFVEKCGRVAVKGQ